MPYPEPVQAVLMKYRILKPDGTPNMRNLQTPVGKPLGPGPIMAPEVIDRLVKADTTPNQRWLNWIFFQAGGGEKSEQAREAALQQIKDRFIDERVNGFEHQETHEYIQPVPKAEAKMRWAKSEARFRDILTVCDQDAVQKLNTFGYFRNWPGNDQIYAKVVAAVEAYLRFYPRLLKMNKELAREDKPPMAESPEGIPSYVEMTDIANKVERYYASKAARDDIRLGGAPGRQDDLIYDDDFITALAPLTWAAAVRYGYDQWAWANRDKFDDVLSNDGRDFNDEWKKRTERGKLYVYLMFKVPVPAWVSRANGQFRRFEFANLALEFDATSMRGAHNPDNWPVYDEENRNTLTVADVKTAIMNEPTRNDPADAELLVHVQRGKNVYATSEEANEVVTHLDTALKAVRDWLASFDPKRIKVDAMKLD